MKFAKKKTATLIALFMMFTIAATFVAVLPNVKAADNVYTSYVYAACAPADWVGVGQDIIFQFWTADMPPDVGEIAAGQEGIRAAWYNVGWYLTDPDGNTETIDIAKTDPVGGAYVVYTPTKTGVKLVKSNKFKIKENPCQRLIKECKLRSLWISQLLVDMFLKRTCYM